MHLFQRWREMSQTQPASACTLEVIEHTERFYIRRQLGVISKQHQRGSYRRTSRNPGSWGITELANRLWCFFCNRDLLIRVCLCKAYTKFGKNLKPILPANKYKTSTPYVKRNQEIQLNFAGSIYDGQNKEKNILVCIDRFSK